MDRLGSIWWVVSRGWWWAGPLLDKELRITSRQGRYYFLRFAYVGLLTLVMLRFWHSFLGSGGGGPAVVQASRLGATGKGVIITILWFQFLAAQILAAVLLGGAISGEIRRRTLEDLLVTPLGAIPIVLGKLLGGLLHVILLLAISLPVLAVVRVLGGVPWDYIVSGVCITFSAAVFAGSLSLLCSILYRHAYHAVLIVGFWYLALWGLDVFTLILLPGKGFINNPAGAFLWSLTSPFHALFVRTQVVLAGPASATPCVPVAWHCLAILIVSGILLVLGARRIRRLPLTLPQEPADESPKDEQTDPWEAARRLPLERTTRRVKGAPLVWKEQNTPLFRASNPVLLHLGLWLAVAGIVVAARVSSPSSVRGSFLPILILEWAFIFHLGVAAASSIAREKEARTWPILLATPLGNGEIICGKAVGAIRRNLPLLMALLAVYALAFLFSPPEERRLPHVVLHVGIPVVHLLGTILLLLGAGLSAGVHCRTVTGAVATAFGIFFCLVFVSSPLCAGVLGLPVRVYPAGMPGAVSPLLFVTLTYAALGAYLLLTAARALRRDAFGKGN